MRAVAGDERGAGLRFERVECGLHLRAGVFALDRERFVDDVFEVDLFELNARRKIERIEGRGLSRREHAAGADEHALIFALPIAGARDTTTRSRTIGMTLLSAVQKVNTRR